MNSNEIMSVLRAARKGRVGLSQKKMASRLGVDRSSYQAWEKGHRDAPLSLVLLACEVLDLEIVIKKAQH